MCHCLLRLALVAAVSLISTAADVARGEEAPATEGESLITLKGHRDGIFSVGFVRGGQVVASASRDGTIRLFDVESGKEQA